MPNVDDPATVERTTAVPGKACEAASGCVPGGVHDTGAVGGRYGMVVTKSGLLFQLGKDGFARAYDVETGKVLWKGKVAGSERGIPVLFETNGREYVLFMSPSRSQGAVVARGRGPAPAAEPGLPSAPAPDGAYGWIAFALPAR